MRIVIDFECNDKKARAEVVKVIKDEHDNIPLYDVMPYIHDALYEYLKNEAKKNMLR